MQASIFFLTLPNSTHRVDGISTISRREHSTAQTRELQCTKAVIPQVIARGMWY